MISFTIFLYWCDHFSGVFRSWLASSAYGFKHSQVRGDFSSWVAKGLWVIAPPKRLIWLVSWIRPPPGVVKLTMDRCSTGNHQMATLGIFYEIIEVWFWVLLNLLLGASPYFTLNSWLCVRGWSLLLNLVILCLLATSGELFNILFAYFSQAYVTRGCLCH